MLQSCVNKMQFHWPCTRISAWIRINFHSQKSTNSPFITVSFVFLSAKYFMQILDIDNLVDNLSILFFDIDNLPIISEMTIYRLSIIFSRYYRPPLSVSDTTYLHCSSFQKQCTHTITLHSFLSGFMQWYLESADSCWQF